MLRIYFLTWLTTLVLFITVFFVSGLAAVGTVAILAGLEVTFSFDNAVINAKILTKMSPIWQKIFMTFGIAIAVFGMRMVLPIVLVSLTAHLGFGSVIDLAFNQPDIYAEKLALAHPSIAAFGGVFLLLIFLDYIFEDRDVQWLRFIERPLGRIGKLNQLSVVVTLLGLFITAEFLAGEHALQVLTAGVLGILAYLGVNMVDSLLESEEDDGEELIRRPARKAAFITGFMMFLKLELIDASFSFDGVIGAFAITNSVLLIAAGLGIGAVHVRSLTVHVIRHGTLAKYRYLEHGAHWAIGTLAVILLVSIKTEVPEYITGGIGIAFILASLISSRRYNSRHPEQVTPEAADNEPTLVKVS